MTWNTLNKLEDLEALPRNIHDKNISKHILVSSSKKWSINDVYLMYYNFEDQMFHFPSYSPKFPDIKLKPVVEINKWMPLPKKPRCVMK